MGVVVIYLFQQDDFLLTSAKNTDIENINLALKSGANINVHYSKEVSTLTKW